MADWSKLPEELFGLIVVRLFSVVELLRFRSTCTTWRSSAATSSLPVRPVLRLNPLLVALSTTREGKEEIRGLDLGASLSRASFLRVTLSSSSSSQGWLIKYDDAELGYGTFRLLNPLSRHPLRHSCKSIDLLEYTVSDIQQGYMIYITQNRRWKREARGFKRSVLGRNGRVLGVGCDGRIRYWNGEIWTRIKDQTPQFCDVIVTGGLTYALDSDGTVWWISSSLDIFRYGPSLDGNVTSGSYRDLSLVECCGEFYIVHRLLGDNLRRIQSNTSAIHDDAGNELLSEVSGILYNPRTMGFEVYKIDEDLGNWVQVRSLGDNAFVMATDTCFSVSAGEFYGCLQNAIYFSDEEEEQIKVFKLDDGSITTMSGYSQSCFQMFVPSFH